MRFIRIICVAALSGVMVGFTAAGAVAGANEGTPGAADVGAAADTPDGQAVGVLCDYHRYGSFNWNDYADDDPGDDVDNVTVYDQADDGYALRVVVTNSSNGNTYSGTARYGERISIGVGNVDNGDHVSVTGVPWKDGSAVCSPYTRATFYE